MKNRYRRRSATLVVSTALCCIMGGAEASLVHYWNFDNTGVDWNGSQDLAATGGASYSPANALVGSSLSLDNGSSSQYLSRSGVDATALNLGTNAFTISFWYRPSEIGVARNILGKAQSTASGSTWWFTQNADNTVSAVLRDGTDAWSGVWTASDTLVADTWFHIAFVHLDGGSSGIYAESIAGTQNNVGEDWHGGAGSTSSGLYAGSTDFVVGGFQGDAAGDRMSGMIDELAIFDTTFSSSEVNDAFLKGQAGTPIAVPEPAAIGLLALSGTLMVWIRRCFLI